MTTDLAIQQLEYDWQDIDFKWRRTDTDVRLEFHFPVYLWPQTEDEEEFSELMQNPHEPFNRLMKELEDMGFHLHNWTTGPDNIYRLSTSEH